MPGTESLMVDQKLHEQSVFSRLRDNMKSVLELGISLASVSALIALAGLYSWCPRCGEWQGDGSEGRGPGVPNPKAPPVPRRLLRAIGLPLTGGPTDVTAMPDRSGNQFEKNERGEWQFARIDEAQGAKEVYGRQSNAHGRRVDAYYDGEPKPDDDPHGHNATFMRGDGKEFQIYNRLKDGTTVHETGVYVNYDGASGAYVWTLKRDPGQDESNGGENA